VTQLLGGAMPVTIHAIDDKRAIDEYWADNEDIIVTSDDWNSTSEARGFASPWWPTSAGQMVGDASGGGLITPVVFYDMWRSFGSNGRLSFVGYTRDSYGSAVGNCTVRCFRTSTTELVSTVTSDANGLYQATSPYGDAHFLTVHKAGTPSIAGASIDSLTPG